MSQIDPSISIPAFYAGRSVFITGATGFMGKVLVEKLLWSCPDVREIFILMRPKKGQSIDQRLYKMLELPIFDRIKEREPSTLKKLVPVTGNTSAEGLGLPNVERRVLIERVSIIYNFAASVRFDDSLKEAVFMNIRSTRDICILAAQMKKLVVFVHVSTAYAQADKPIVEEKLYPSEADWKKTIKIAETVDDNLLRTLTPKYLKNFPNTYTFTKRLAEQIVSDYSHVIPFVMFRPSIVISSLHEPLPGWVDNFNGPVGLLIGGGKGVLRVVLSNPSIKSDFIPVDVAIKAMIIASWKRGIQTITKDPSVHVYNCCSADIKSISVEEISNMGFRWIQTIPLEGIIWRPSIIYLTNKLLFHIFVLMLHVLPSLILDFILKLSGKKPILLNLVRKVFIANNALAYFLLNEWNFKNDRLMGLLTDVLPADTEKFGFEYASFDVNLYFKQCMIGAKKYLLKESIENLPAAIKHQNNMIWIDKVFKSIIAILFIWMSFRFGLVLYITSSIESLISGFD